MNALRKSILVAVLTVVFLGKFTGQAPADEPAGNLYKKALRSVALIMTNTGSGTGWLVDEEHRLLVTNYHVVGDNLNVTVVFPVMKDGVVIADSQYYFRHAPRQRGRVIDFSENNDLAVVQLESWPEGGLALPLAAASAGPGDTVHSIGNPGASDACWVYTNGAVRAVYQKKLSFHIRNRKLRLNTRVVETQSPTNPGDSGGPLLNNDGEVVGVTQGVSNKDRLVSWFVDVNVVRTFVEQCLCQLEPAAAADFIHRAERYFLRGLYDHAIADLNRALKLDPESAPAHSWRGASYLLKNNLDNAMADIDRAIELDPSNARAWLRRGSIFSKKRDFGQAIAEYSRALDLEPNFAQACYLRGRVCLAEKNLDAAISDFNTAIRLNPDYSEAYCDRATALQMQKRYQEAIVDFTRALDGTQDVATVLTDRGCCAYALKRWNEAFTDWNDAVACNPKCIWAWSNMVVLLRQNREFDRALQICNKAIAANSGTAHAYFIRGEVLEAVGNYSAASQDYERAIDLDRNFENKTKRYESQFIRVVNKTGATIRVYVLYECHTTEGWLWYPDTDLDQPLAFTLLGGDDVSLLHDNWKIKARRMRIWAETTDGSFIWDQGRDRDVLLVDGSYRALQEGTFTYTFN